MDPFPASPEIAAAKTLHADFYRDPRWLAADRTRVQYTSWVWDRSRLNTGAALDRVEREDEAIVEAVQRGVRSRFYARGRYSPRWETGVHQFHGLLKEALA